VGFPPPVEDGVDHGGVLGEAAVVFLGSRLLTSFLAQLALHAQQFRQESRPSGLLYLGQEVLDPSVRPRSPGPLEPLGGRVDPGPVFCRDFAHCKLREPIIGWLKSSKTLSVQE
jgi:hypothetical protein